MIVAYFFFFWKHDKLITLLYRKSRNGDSGSINGLIKNLVKKLPTYLFLTAVPQLISRICTSNRPVHHILETILIKVLIAFPQQTLWHLVGVSKSKYKIRSGRCLEIFRKASAMDEFANASIINVNVFIIYIDFTNISKIGIYKFDE